MLLYTKFGIFLHPQGGSCGFLNSLGVIFLLGILSLQSKKGSALQRLYQVLLIQVGAVCPRWSHREHKDVFVCLEQSHRT